MKKLLFILFLFVSFQSMGQRFPSIDSLQTYILKYFRNSTVETFTNLRGQNIVYGTTEFLEDVVSGSGVDSIWIVDGGADADTLRYRRWGVTYSAGLISGGGGGSSYTFSNGVKESGGAVTAGGTFETDSISYVSNSSKVFRIQSRTAAGSVNLTDALFKPTTAYIKVIGSSASIYTSSTLTSSQIEHKSTQTDGTTTDILVAPASISLRRYGVAISRMLKVASTIDFSNSAGSLISNSFGADSSIHYKRLTYGDNYRSEFTPFTLVDKGYVDSLAGTISGSTVLNNVGTGYDVAVQGTDGVKRLQAGWRIKLDSATSNVVKIAIDTTTQTLTDGATITFDANSGVSAQVTLGGNRTLAFSNFSAGVYLTLVVIQDGTGSRTLTLPAGTKVINGGAGAVTLTTAASSQDILTFFKIGTTIYCNYGKNYN